MGRSQIMLRSATPSRSTLLAAVAVASLAAIGVGASAIHDREPAGTAAPESPAVVAAPVAVAAPPTSVPTPAPARKSVAVAVAAPYGASGLRIQLDPETGDMVPATGEDAAMSRSSEGLIEIHRPDGSVMVDLEGRFQEHSVMVRDASGRLRARCVHDPARALDPRHLCADESALPSAER
jgi:hypothetical protein